MPPFQGGHLNTCVRLGWRSAAALRALLLAGPQQDRRTRLPRTRLGECPLTRCKCAGSQSANFGGGPSQPDGPSTKGWPERAWRKSAPAEGATEVWSYNSGNDHTQTATFGRARSTPHSTAVGNSRPSTRTRRAPVSGSRAGGTAPSTSSCQVAGSAG